MTRRAHFGRPGDAVIAAGLAGLLLISLVLALARFGGSPAAPLPLRVVAVNSASASELVLLPRIGPRLAQRIVADRQERGPFLAAEDLARVPGIGARTVARLAPLITLEPGLDRGVVLSRDQERPKEVSGRNDSGGASR